MQNYEGPEGRVSGTIQTHIILTIVHVMFIIKTLNDNGDSLVMNDGDLVL